MESVLTVVICTYNRAHFLESCLQSLMEQSVAPRVFSLLVVDNNSTDSTKVVADRFVQYFPAGRIVKESRQGLSHARNRAVAECRTPWLAFLDDDAKASPGWVETVLDTIARDDFDAFGGPYTAWLSHGPLPAWLPENYGAYMPDHHYGSLEPGKAHIPGGNCAIRMDALRATGSFSCRMGMSGSRVAYGEETLLFFQMSQKGFRLGFVPDMVIEHCVLRHKYRLSWHLRAAYAGARDWTRIECLLGRSPELATCVRHCLRAPLANLSLWRHHPWQRASFLYVREFFSAIGRLVGRMYPLKQTQTDEIRI